MASGQQRLKNLGTFDEYIDRLVGEDDINNLTGRTREDLEKLGHIIKDEKGGFGGYQAIMLLNGVYFGASESRKDGQASGY